MRLPFELHLALRHLIAGRWQTVATCGGVAVAVLLVVFLSALTRGVETRIGRDMSEFMAAVTVEPPDHSLAELQTAAHGANGGAAVVRRVDDRLAQRRLLEGWGPLAETIRREPGVRQATPTVKGQVLLRFRAEARAVTLIAAAPEQQDEITPVEQYLVRGRYRGLNPDEVVIGWSLAREMGADLGDRVRLTSSEDVTDTFTLAGIYDTGADAADLNRAFITLRAGQSLLRTGNHVTSIAVRLEDSRQADALAERLERLFPCKAESWMRTNSGTLAMLSMQTAARTLIIAFTLAAASLGISSVLAISVLQKSRQIGILRAIGARKKQILTVFALEGLLVGIIGAPIGAALAAGLLQLLEGIPEPLRASGRAPGPLFPIELHPEMIYQAMAMALLTTVAGSLIPARRAARLNPVEVIHGE